MATNMNFALDEDIFSTQNEQAAPKHEGDSIVVDKMISPRQFYED